MFVLLVFSTSLMAANVTIKAKNESLKSVLEKITQQTGYEFAYSNAINPNSIKVNVEVTNQDSDVFFKEFFSKYGIVYKVSGKTISLSKQDLANQQPQQKDLKDNQNVKISGVVLDENGASLPGVYVMVKGTKRGTTTDITGKYELDCTVGEKLEYSCMGFKNVEMTVSKSLNPFKNVVMAEDLVALEEAVVIGWDPYEANIEKFLERGEDIELTLVCSRRNTYGPLHLTPPIHSAYGPGHWVTGGAHWSDDYVLIDSGVFGLSVEG